MTGRQSNGMRRIPTAIVVILSGIAAYFAGASVSAVSHACADEPSFALSVHDRKILDSDGDPLPVRVTVRLGTKRYRPTRTSAGLAFMTGTHLLAVPTTDGFLEHWDADTGRLQRDTRMLAHTLNHGTHAVYTPDGRFIALRGARFDVERGKPIDWLALADADTGHQRLWLEPDQFRGDCLAISPDGRTIAGDMLAGGEQKVCVFDVATKSEVASRLFGKMKMESMAFSPDGETIAIGTQYGKVLLWNWHGDGEPREVDVCHDPRRTKLVLSLTFSADGSELAVGSQGDEEPGVRVVSMTDPSAIRAFSAEGVEHWYPRSVAFSRNGRLLAAPIDGNNARGGLAVWDAASGELLHRFEVPSATYAFVAFSRDGSRLAAGSSWDTQFAVWELPSGTRLGNDLPGHVLPPTALRFLPNNDRLVSAGDDATIRVWDMATATELRVLHHDAAGKTGIRWVRAMDVSPDGQYIASSSLDDTVRLWDVATGRSVFEWPGHGRQGGQRAVRFTADGKIVASWGDDLHVRLWDVGTGVARADYRLQPAGIIIPDKPGADPFREGPRIYGGLFSPDASRFLLQLGDTTYVFETLTGKELTKLTGAARHSPGIAVSPDNQLLLSHDAGKRREVALAGGGVAAKSADEHPVRLTSLADGKTVQEIALPGSGFGPVAFSPDGRRAAVAWSGAVESEPRVLLLSVPELKEISALAGLDGRPRALEFSHSGKSVAVSTEGSSVLVWDVSAASEVTP
jgi:WD40 repeat protein